MTPNTPKPLCLYLQAHDPRFFQSLHTQGPTPTPEEYRTLRTLELAQSTHQRTTIDPQAIHTADICAALHQHSLSTQTGLAPLLAAQAGISTALNDLQHGHPATWMRLTPVYWATARDHVNIHALTSDPVASTERQAHQNDWAQLLPHLTPWLNELGWEVHIQPEQAYLRAPQGFDYHAPSLELAQSDILEQFLPHGKDLTTWQKLLTEFQMLLHNHPINNARQQRGAWPINSLWLDHNASAAQLQNATPASNLSHITHPKHPTITYQSTLSTLAEQLQPIAHALQHKHTAQLELLSDAPHACIHHIQWRPLNLWQTWQLRRSLTQYTAQYTAQSTARRTTPQTAHHSLTHWLTPCLTEPTA